MTSAGESAFETARRWRNVVDSEQLAGDRRPMLSTLWIFVLLNALFRDVHELFRPGVLEQMIAGNVNGTEITEHVILLGGVLLEVPLAMVVLARLLQPRISRIANLVVAVATVPLLLGGGIRDLDDGFFAAVQVTSLVGLAWLAWRWTPRGP